MKADDVLSRMLGMEFDTFDDAVKAFHLASGRCPVGNEKLMLKSRVRSIKTNTDAIAKADAEHAAQTGESILMPIMNERIEAVEGLQFNASTKVLELQKAFAEANANAIDKMNEKAVEAAQERFRIFTSMEDLEQRVKVLELMFRELGAAYDEVSQGGGGYAFTHLKAFERRVMEFAKKR